MGKRKQNVFCITSGELIDKREADEDCIAKAKDLLERAKSGEIKGFVAVGICYDGSGYREIAGRASDASLIGRLEVVKAMLVEGLM